MVVGVVCAVFRGKAARHGKPYVDPPIREERFGGLR